MARLPTLHRLARPRRQDESRTSQVRLESYGAIPLPAPRQEKRTPRAEERSTPRTSTWSARDSASQSEVGAVWLAWARCAGRKQQASPPPLPGYGYVHVSPFSMSWRPFRHPILFGIAVHRQQPRSPTSWVGGHHTTSVRSLAKMRGVPGDPGIPEHALESLLRIAQVDIDLTAAPGEHPVPARHLPLLVQCNDPPEPAQVRLLRRTPQRGSSCPAPDEGAGGCRSASSRRSDGWPAAATRIGGGAHTAP